MNDDRGPWYLLTGIALGIAIGLVYAWLIRPVVYVDTSPATLRDDFKDQYRALIASAYMADGDLNRAKARLALLKDPDIARSLTIQAQRALAENQSPAEAQALGLLAVSFSQGSTAFTPSVSTAAPGLPEPTNTATDTPGPTQTPPVAPTETLAATPSPAFVPNSTGVVSPTLQASPTPQASPTRGPSPTPTRTPLATFTPRPTNTPTPTPGAPFVLKDKQPICDINLIQPVIMVEARNASNQPVPGVEVVVNWQDGEDHFYTGLKPEMGQGYGDYDITNGVTYTVHLGDGGQPVGGLSANDCKTASGQHYWGSWRLVFSQP